MTLPPALAQWIAAQGWALHQHQVEMLARADAPATLLIAPTGGGKTVLAAHAVPGDRLVLQIPESKVFTHLKAVQAFQVAVAALGCRVALEQFGTGLNSFQMLSHFDPAILKIDRSFITELGKNADVQKQVRDIVEKAHQAGKLALAEFVSDASTMSVLFGMGVDFVEGNFLAAPGPQMNYDFG